VRGHIFFPRLLQPHLRLSLLLYTEESTPSLLTGVPPSPLPPCFAVASKQGKPAARGPFQSVSSDGGLGARQGSLNGSVKSLGGSRGGGGGGAGRSSTSGSVKGAAEPKSPRSTGLHGRSSIISGEKR
jgi:hypothetical protein